MRYFQGIVCSLFIAIANAPAIAADCDFNQKIGSCAGTIEVLSTSGSKKSYAAELMIHSSAATCSRVEYYVNSTPYRTVLGGSNSEPESLSSTSPIQPKDVSVGRCTAYLDRDTADGKAQEENKKAADMSAGLHACAVDYCNSFFSRAPSFNVHMTVSLSQCIARDEAYKAISDLQASLNKWRASSEGDPFQDLRVNLFRCKISAEGG
ncbi:hypothetical protein [Mesorhizobium sp. M0589]|uniref:hypothetical protein n=1 Tax=Mesorhizobium sp. M0589 TaxID=2956965 RepID=UPI003334FA12